MAHASVARRWDLNNDRAGTAELEKKKKIKNKFTCEWNHTLVVPLCLDYFT
jgi:hypothetical protein